MSRIGIFHFVGVVALTALAGCPPQDCPPEKTGELTGWVTGASFRGSATVAPEGAVVETGEDALVENFACYAVDKFVTIRGRFDPSTVSQLTGEVLDFGSPPSDLTGDKVRIVLDCDGVAPQLVTVRWYGRDGRAVGTVPVSLPSKPDSGLIDGKGYLCVYNPTNVNVKVTTELYLPQYACVAPSAHIDSTHNLQGGISAKVSCAASPPPLSLCSDPNEFPGYHAFCQICSGSFTTRTTVEFYGYCHDVALALAQSEAANCEIREGACN